MSVSGSTGLAALGVYKLGVRFGWWGQANNAVVIDDKKDGSGGDGSSGDGSSGGGSGSRIRATGKPPNISGDKQGYNTVMFPSPAPWYRGMGCASCGAPMGPRHYMS